MRAYLGLGTGLLLLVLGMFAFGSQQAAAIAQGFRTSDRGLVAGALVSLTKTAPDAVERSTTNNLEQLTGVVSENSALELSSGSSSVQVVTSGSTPALVSDLNGTIKSGDKITASPIAGVGMKAASSTLVIGSAVSNFVVASSQAHTLTDKTGHKTTVHIGAVLVQVDKVFYQAPETQNAFLAPALQDLANNLIGRQVSPVRVLVAGLLVLALFTTIAVLLYSSVRSSIISIGRNPLAESAVRKSLLQIGALVLGLLAFTMLAVYMILSL